MLGFSSLTDTAIAAFPLPTVYAWTKKPDAAETWDKQSNASESWSKQSKASETWAAVHCASA